MKLFNEKLIRGVEDPNSSPENLSLEIDMLFDEIDIILTDIYTKKTAIVNLNSIKDYLLRVPTVENIYGLFKDDFNTIGIVKDTPIEVAIESIESAMTTIQSNLDNSEINTNDSIESFGSTLLSTYSTVADSMIPWALQTTKSLQKQIDKFKELSKQDPSYQKSIMESTIVRCPKHKELHMQFVVNQVILKRASSEFYSKLDKVDRNVYRRGFKMLNVQVDIDSGKIEGDGKLSTDKVSLLSQGYTIKNTLELLEYGKHLNNVISSIMPKVKQTLNTLAKVKAQSVKRKNDTKFVLVSIKKAMQIFKRDISILYHITKAIKVKGY